MAQLTAQEQAHLVNLQTLYEALQTSSADPATSIAVREALRPKIEDLADQIDEVEAGVFSRGTVDLQAQAQVLAPAMKLLKDLKAELATVAAGMKDAAEIAGYVEQAISTCQSLLG
jgi:hypothetical protein